ncbi:13013_t:CDS:2, partial [Funneliformis geosporum]
HNVLGGEYNDLYLKIDVLSLANDWTAFRKTFMHYYGLDPSICTFSILECHAQNYQGGIAMALHRHFQANNP